MNSNDSENKFKFSVYQELNIKKMHLIKNKKF